MVTYEQAVAIADAWLNGSASPERRREVRTHEFDLGWVVWAVPAGAAERDRVAQRRRSPSDTGDACGVVDRRTGELSTWPSVPVEEVVRMYRDKHASDLFPYDPSLPPVVGPGNSVVFTYRDSGGEESAITRLSGPGMPPPEIQIWTELRWMGVRPEAVVGVHSDLYPADLPGGYHGRFLRDTLGGVEVSCSHDYGPTRAARARGMAALVDRTETVQRLTGAAPRPRPNRVPFPPGGPGRPVTDGMLQRTLSEAFLQVRRYGADLLADSGLPETVRTTLGRAGLPGLVPYFFAADSPNHPPAGGLFCDAATHLRARGVEVPGPAAETLAEYVRIGSDGGGAVAVRRGAPDTGSVWVIDVRTGASRYVNRSVAEFCRCLVLLSRTLPTLRGRDPYAAGRGVAEFQEALADIDGSVFGDPEHWWAVIVEQMWDGLL
ncbi:SUKH-4 family immunity protein [Thermobifida halotolerans]|uniref:SUKH-4 family immunity protein n=1 Tax=Thermobifida halotolerans TaxID=483545 RepID=A0A399G9T9_9ACTN|nr:SUKH-4 family immunity protein [Thermobifida halotolerans]UOE21053.1 SUKH-4 family immunity protein [Thermobifida halotolerans]